MNKIHEPQGAKPNLRDCIMKCALSDKNSLAIQKPIGDCAWLTQSEIDYILYHILYHRIHFEILQSFTVYKLYFMIKQKNH